MPPIAIKSPRLDERHVRHSWCGYVDNKETYMYRLDLNADRLRQWALKYESVSVIDEREG